MRYGLAVLIAFGAFLPGCSCLRKESKKKEKKTMRAPQPMPAKRMAIPRNDQMQMPPRMAPEKELALFDMQEKEIDIIPEASAPSDELPLAQELMGLETGIPEEIDIEEIEMPVQTQEDMDIMDM